MAEHYKKKIRKLSGAELRSALGVSIETKSKADEIIERAEAEANLILESAAQKRDEEYQRLDSISEDVLKSFIDEDAIQRYADVFVMLLLQIKAIKDDHNALLPWITELVETCVRKIIGNLDEPELLARMVSQSLLEIGVEEAVQVTVHPSTHSAFEQAQKKYPEVLKNVATLRVDPILSPGLLNISSSIGRIEISFEAQLLKIIDRIEDVAKADGGVL